MNINFQATIDKLNAEILAKHSDDKPLFEKMSQIQRDLGLTFNERTTCPFLRPHFIARSKYNEIAKAAQIIAQACERLTEVALADDKLLDKFDLTEREIRLARLNPKYSTLCVTSRLDTFINGDEFKFLEYNAETPAGVGDQMQLERVLSSVSQVKDFLSNNSHWRPQPHRKLLESLVKTYREFGGKKRHPNIAIVDWDGVSTAAEFETLKDYFESIGYPTLIVDPNDLEYDSETLRADSFEIDIFYKRVVIHELLEKSDDNHPIIKAYADGNLFMANSFRVKIVHKKASLAILSDEKYADIFTAEQLETIRKHIPWTRKVEDSQTNYNGKEISLLEFLRENREKLLLKPNDDYGGKGVVLGWETSQSEWENSINEALKTSFVAQERAVIHKETFPMYEDSVALEELLVDFDPFLFLNEVEGGMVRLSASSIVNVTQGGGQTALYVLENY